MPKKTPQQVREELAEILQDIERETSSFLKKADTLEKKIEDGISEASEAIEKAQPELEKGERETAEKIDTLLAESLDNKEKDDNEVIT